MAMKSERRANYESRDITSKFELLPNDVNKTSPISQTAHHMKHEPFLPKIHVEACGLTVESRDRDSWKRAKGGSSKSWKPGKKRRNKHRILDGINLDTQTMATRDGFHTREQRVAESEAQGLPSERSAEMQDKPSEFVGSLKVGGFLQKDERVKGNSRLERAIRWPVGKLMYSTPHTKCMRTKTESSISLNEATKTRLSPISSTQLIPIDSEKASPRERVILNKLAAKRKRQTAQGALKHGRIVNSDDPSVGDRPSPINFDQYLPTTHCINLATLTESKPSKTCLRGDEYYDVIDHTTQRLLEMHQTVGSTTSENTSSESQAETSGYGSLDEGPSQPRSDHTKDCPLNNDFRPSDVGHLCPPNSPDFFKYI